MADYREIRKVADELYERYGGMMTVTDASKELGTNRNGAKRWLEQNVPGIRIGERVRYETRLFAKAIVNLRGFC